MRYKVVWSEYSDGELKQDAYVTGKGLCRVILFNICIRYETANTKEEAAAKTIAALEAQYGDYFPHISHIEETSSEHVAGHTTHIRRQQV